MKHLLSSFIFYLLPFIFFSCSSDDNGTDFDELTGEITLSVSKSLIEADGQDVVTFSVEQGGIDVTSNATIYQKLDGKWTPFAGSQFATATLGTYEFSADHYGQSSESVFIQAATGLGELPADSEPNKFDSFRKRVMAMQFTGIDCGFCPYVIKAIEDFQATSKAEDVVFAALHSRSAYDPMFSDDAWKVSGNMNISSYPTVVYNLYDVSKAENTTALSISSLVDTYMAKGAKSAISASVFLDDSGTKLKVQGAVKIAKDGTYRVAVWLLEDSIQCPQANYANISISDIHNNSVRLCSTTSPEGAQFGGRNEWKAGETGVYYHEFDLTKANLMNQDNCRVVVYVTAVEGVYCVVDNVISTGIGEVKTFEYID